MARKPGARTVARRRPAGAPAWTASPDEVVSSEERLERVASLLAHGQAGLASQSLLPVLDVRAVAGDRECALAAAALRLALAPPAAPPPPVAPKPEGALSAALDRLVAVVKQQDEQIRTLQALLETVL